MKSKVLSIILGGGKGTRLYPLTKDRAKPAVPFGGKYRLVDIPISNCINSDLRQIYILTQFNSASLHMHLASTFQFDTFSKGFCEILAAEQTFDHSGWYMGTADAVRKNFSHFRSTSPEYYMILSGDQLYRMDLEHFMRTHIESGAEVTIAATPVTREQADDLGILQVDKKRIIQSFREKPGPEPDISDMKMPREAYTDENGKQYNAGRHYLASMGIYIFNASTMDECLDNDHTDFGHEIIPEAIQERKVNAYIYNGFWEDIGTIKSFYECNINLASVNPDFNFYDEDRPIYTHRRDLPTSKINFCTISQSLASEGSIITNASIVNSIVGIRTIIESGANLEGVVSMGADFYETESSKAANDKKGIPHIGIGAGSIIKNAIIDKNARIGNGCRIGIDNKKRPDGDYDNYYIRDGLIVIPKNAVLPAGTVI